MKLFIQEIREIKKKALEKLDNSLDVKGEEEEKCVKLKHLRTVYIYFPTKNMVCPLYRGKFGLNFSRGANKLCSL